MNDQEQIFLQLQTAPTETGFNILPINAGLAKGHGLMFSAQVLKDSLPMWDNLPCFLDHDYTGNQSVRHLAGALHSPSWNEAEEGIQAALIPGGPGAKDLQALRLAARSDPAIMEAVGFSAHLYITQKNGTVTSINKVRSVDCVIDPARGGKFLAEVASSRHRLLRSQEASNLSTLIKGESNMNEKEEQKEQLEGSDAETQALLDVQAAKKAADEKVHTAAESLRLVRIRTCEELLKVSLQASGLPAPSADRVSFRFKAMLDKGEPFEPVALDNAISEEQTLLSNLTAAGIPAGAGSGTFPHRLSWIRLMANIFCEECGNELPEGSRWNRRYCSGECVWLAHRRTRRESATRTRHLKRRPIRDQLPSLGMDYVNMKLKDIE